MKRDFRGRIKSDTGQDRFSTLPEPLINEILSRMEFKDAVKTSLLSKPWKYSWTKVHNIILRHIDDQSLASVHNALTRCTTPKINTFCLDGYSDFSLDFDGRSDFSSVIDNWISFAFERNVEIMELSHFWNIVPQRVFHSWSITTLELRNVDIVPLPSSVSMSSLKTLQLENPSLTFDKASLDKLLEGCPVLETLVLDVYHLHHFDIPPRVKRFKLVWFEEEENIYGNLVINAPGLQELELSARLFVNKCKLVDVSSLTKATIILKLEPEEEATLWAKDVAEFNYGWIEMVSILLGLLSNVAELTIGSSFLQVLSFMKLQCIPSPLFKCKHLSLQTSLWKFDLLGIACLLENAPHLETLFIKVVPFLQDKHSFAQTELLIDGNPHWSLPIGTFMHLKNVKIAYHCSLCYDSERNRVKCFDFELVEYILRSCLVLKKLVICSLVGSHDECRVPSCTFRYVPRLSSKLIVSFLGENETAAEWKLKKSKNKFVYTFSDYASLRPTTGESSSSYPPLSLLLGSLDED